ncbi:MAG: hypothetical protein M3Z75_05575 [Actinomycetota bacterium]|nr:hypothetical protein [Actinomycetota bacterium]
MIAEVARYALATPPVRRRGRSRTWAGDHGRWIGIAEFRPPSRGVGSS